MERGDASSGLCRFITWFFPKDAVGKDGEVSRRSGFVGEGRPRFFGGSFLLAEVVASAAASARLRMRAESRGVRGGDVIVVIAVVVVAAEDRRRLGARGEEGAFPARGRFSPFAAGRFLAGVLTAPFFGARLALGGGATGSRSRAVFDRAVGFLARVASSGAVFVRGGLGDDEGFFSAAAFFSCAQYAPFASARLPKVPRVTVARVRASYARTFHRVAPSEVTVSRMYEPGMGSCLGGGAMAAKRAPCVSRGSNSLRPLFVSSSSRKSAKLRRHARDEKVARLLRALALIPRVVVRCGRRRARGPGDARTRVGGFSRQVRDAS